MLFQSTFPRGERRVLCNAIPYGMKFQSTFPRGERHTGIFILNISAYFNPRSRVGNDMSRYLTGGGTVHISIHVPAWGTTIKGPGSIEYGFISIHVPAWGTTKYQTRISKCHTYFNPRSRVGNDTARKHFQSCVDYFNPRSRVGNDVISNPLLKGVIISIHVPAWGTTI